MITENEALALLRRYVDDEKRIAHCTAVAEFACDLASRILEKHPGLPVNPQKVRIAGLLHDIGRGLPGDHEANSVDILKKEGLGDVAGIVMHGTLYEIRKLRGLDDRSLLPQTLENKIVAYADARVKLRPMSLEERWADIEKRRGNDAEKMGSLRMAQARFYALERELTGLAV